MAITTLDDFKRYCLRSLGAPVVTIDVTDEQIQDRYEDALRKFQDHHFDGTERMYLKHQVTQEDIDNKYIPIPSYVSGIIRILPFTSGVNGATGVNPFSIQYQLRLNDIWDMGSTSVVYYTQLMQYTSMLDQMLNGRPLVRFNRVQDKLYIDTDWEKKVGLGHYIIVECYRALDPTEFVQMFDNPWFKRYATALMKRQWGENLKKFGGVQMIGGVTLNGQQIWNEAVQDVAVLEKELRDVWEEPIDAIYMG